MTDKFGVVHNTIKANPHEALQDWGVLTHDLSPEEYQLACELLSEALVSDYGWRIAKASDRVWSCPSKNVVCADTRKTTPLLAA